MLLLTITLILTLTLTLTLTVTLSINPNTDPNPLPVRRSGPQVRSLHFTTGLLLVFMVYGLALGLALRVVVVI